MYCINTYNLNKLHFHISTALSALSKMGISNSTVFYSGVMQKVGIALPTYCITSYAYQSYGPLKAQPPIYLSHLFITAVHNGAAVAEQNSTPLY